MTDESTTARKMAIDCEAIKYSYRQSKDGIVVSFLIHPQHVPDGLAVAALGTRYIVALVELGDDETPRPPKRKEVTPEPRPDTKSKPTSHATGGARSWDELSSTQQAGIRCKEPAFWRYLRDRQYIQTESEKEAASFVHKYCDVVSRRDIDKSSFAIEQWDNLDDGFQDWMREPSVVG